MKDFTIEQLVMKNVFEYDCDVDGDDVYCITGEYVVKDVNGDDVGSIAVMKDGQYFVGDEVTSKIHLDIYERVDL